MGNHWFPVGYFSRLLSDTEKRWAIYDLEILAAFDSMQYFADLLLAHNFTLITDNRAVSFIRKKKDLNGKLARYALFMEEYDFQIKLKPGVKNSLADFLSRYPVNHKLVDEKNITIKELNEFENDVQSINCLVSNMAINPENRIISDNLYKIQIKDPELNSIIKVLKTNQINSENKYIKYIFENFCLKNNILFKYVESDKNVDNFVICVPFESLEKLLESYHDLNTSGHFGIKRTIAKLSERFFFPQMSEFIEIYIKSCILCQMRKSPKTKIAGLMAPIITGSVWEMVSIDHLGPLNKSFGCQWIIVLTDNFSKIALAKPMATKNAKSVAKFIFEDLILTYACIPQKLLSDCSQSFLGKIVSHLNILMGIKQLKTSGFRPSTNSLTERYNCSLGHCLSMYVNKEQNDWAKYVKPVVYAYNCTVQASTGYSPIEVVFGVKATLPPDVELNLNKIRGTPSEYALGLAKYLKDVKTNVFERLSKVHKRAKQRYDLKRRDYQLSEGQKVLFYNPGIVPGRFNKMLKRWEGPHIVRKQLSPLLYELDFKGTALKSNVCHISRLKIFYDRKELIEKFKSKQKSFIPKSVLKYKGSQNIESKTYSKVTPNQSKPNKTSVDTDSDCDSDDTDLYYFDYSSDSDTSDSDPEVMPNNPNPNEPQTPVLQPNYNVSDGLRRSVRRRTAPNRLSLSIASILCMFSLFASIDCLANVEPIIWHRIDNPVIEGLDTVTTVIDYKSPCFLFDELLIDSEATFEMKNWCQSLFETNFIKPINQFCTSVGKQDSVKFGLIREKRFIFTGILAIFTIVSIVTAIGLGATSMVQTVRTNAKIHNLEIESSIAMKKLGEIAQKRIDRAENII